VEKQFRILVAIILFWGVSASAQFVPMIQTHTFQMEPYLKSSQGYAFFIYSNSFSGNETVTVHAPANALLPDIKAPSRVLNQYSSGQWFISDDDRELSATQGPLPEGIYTATIQTSTKSEAISFPYHANFLLPATDITINIKDSSIDVSWKADPSASTFWIFVFPVHTTNILKELIPVSSVMHVGSSYQFTPKSVPRGVYKIAIRSNRLWEGGVFWGVDSESWSISNDSFTVPGNF
jgi:hypothetical protein